MPEDEKPVETEVTVSDKEINEINKEIDQVEGNKETKIAERVRKEIEAENKLKALEQSKVDLEKQLEEQKKTSEQLKKEQEEAIQKVVEQRVSEEVTKRKAIVSSASPFKQTEETRADLVKNLTSDDVERIEKTSYDAFIENRGRSK